MQISVKCFTVLFLLMCFKGNGNATMADSIIFDSLALVQKAKYSRVSLIILNVTRDLGRVTSRQKLNCSFRFAVTRGDSLRVDSLVSLSKRIVPKMEQRTLGPLDTGYIYLEYQTNDNFGQFTDSIIVYTNSLKKSVVQLHVKGWVYPSVTIHPLMIKIHGIQVSSGWSDTIYITWERSEIPVFKIVKPPKILTVSPIKKDHFELIHSFEIPVRICSCF